MQHRALRMRLSQIDNPDEFLQCHTRSIAPQVASDAAVVLGAEDPDAPRINIQGPCVDAAGYLLEDSWIWVKQPLSAQTLLSSLAASLVMLCCWRLQLAQITRQPLFSASCSMASCSLLKTHVLRLEVLQEARPRGALREAPHSLWLWPVQARARARTRAKAAKAARWSRRLESWS